MSRKLLLFVLITVLFGILIATHESIVRFAYAFGTYFLDDKFVTADAAPISDPHTTEPGGQSVDAVEVDGSLAVSSGALIVLKQSTAVDGDLGLRYNSSASRFIGRATFFKVLYSDLTNGIANESNISSALGFTSATDVIIEAKAGNTSIGTSQTLFLMLGINTTDGQMGLMSVPSEVDTFYLAYILGGFTGTSLTASTPWYPGQALADNSAGAFTFIKKGATGHWILEGFNTYSSTTTHYPVISSFTTDMSVDRWIVLGDNDSLYNPYLKPKNFQACNHTSGQLFDDTPEFGVAYDSTHGDFVFSSNAVLASGTSPGAMGYVSTFASGDSNAMGYVVSNINNTSTGRITGLVMRYKASDTSYMLAQVSTTADAIQIFSFNGTTFTQRATTATIIPSNGNFTKFTTCAIIDSTVYAWQASSDNTTSVTRATYTSGLITKYGGGLTKHGIKGDVNTSYRVLTWRELGRDGEFDGLNEVFDGTRKRGKMIIIQ